MSCLLKFPNPILSHLYMMLPGPCVNAQLPIGPPPSFSRPHCIPFSHPHITPLSHLTALLFLTLKAQPAGSEAHPAPSENLPAGPEAHPVLFKTLLAFPEALHTASAAHFVCGNGHRPLRGRCPLTTKLTLNSTLMKLQGISRQMSFKESTYLSPLSS